MGLNHFLNCLQRVFCISETVIIYCCRGGAGNLFQNLSSLVFLCFISYTYSSKHEFYNLTGIQSCPCCSKNFVIELFNRIFEVQDGKFKSAQVDHAYYPEHIQLFLHF